MAATVLITGASSGIGKATVRYFQARGWNVVATMRRPDQEKELINLPRVSCLRLDVLDEVSIASAIAEGQAAFGRIDVLVNNAGYGASGAFEAATAKDVQQQFDTNVFGLMNVTRAMLPLFRQQRSGVIINISSMGGRITFPLYSLYHSTKWAVEGFSESLQYELRPFGIRVKLVEPGAIKTDFYGRSQTVFRRSELTAYDAYQTPVLAAMHQAGITGSPPEVVAQVIFRAATDGSSRMRYVVGGNAPLLLALRRLLPDRWFQAMVRRSLEPR